MKNILIIRFSAFGDVALTVPVIDAILTEHQDVKITLLTRAFFKPLFPKHPRFEFKSADLKGKHKGVIGLRKLYQELKPNDYDVVIDLHDVIRTKVLRTYFKLGGTKTIIFDKGRKVKKELVAGTIPFQKLPHTTERYLKSFEQINLTSEIDLNKKWLTPTPSSCATDFITNLRGKVIGIAPFAAKPSKEWGIDKVDELIHQLKESTILLFGAGEREKNELEKLADKYENAINLVGKFNLEEELAIIDRLDAMVAMDSANMHLATLVQTPVVSIWGPTHYFLGFGPLNNEDNIVEIPKEQLPCRPCSVFGKLENKDAEKCAHQSMEQISVKKVLEKLTKITLEQP